MTTHCFDVQMGRLQSVFGERSFSDQRRKLIWKWSNDLHDYEFTRIVDYMLDTMRTPPLPVDFKDAAGKEKRARPSRGEKVISAYAIHCDTCFDSGVCQAMQGKFLTLARCDCGAECTWKLPHIGDVRDFKKAPLELRWFQANDVWTKAMVWREKVRIAEHFWQQRGKE